VCNFLVNVHKSSVIEYVFCYIDMGAGVVIMHIRPVDNWLAHALFNLLWYSIMFGLFGFG